MENKILSKEELRNFIKSHRVNYSIQLKRHYIQTVNFINSLYNDINFNEKLYLYLNENINNECIVCGSKTKFENYVKGYRKYCSQKCVNKSIITKEKRICKICKKKFEIHKCRIKNTCSKICAEKYSQMPDIKEKQKTNLKISVTKKYGVENYSQTQECKRKVKQTKLLKYGNENYCNSDKIRKNLIKRYEDDKYWQFRKSTYKPYILPSGKEIKVQGYENISLDFLLKIYKEHEIVFSKKEIPKFEYIMGGISHHYIPDFYLPNENTIIEVKSEWTLNKNKDSFDLKKQSVLKNGYKFKVLVFDNRERFVKYE